MKKLFISVVVLAMAGIAMQAQTVRFVDNNQGAPTATLNYTSIQAAINASTPGDIIYVQPSPNSYGNINIDRRINLYGIAFNPELNAGQYAYIANITFTGPASDTKISGLYITNINLNTNNLNLGIVISNNRINGTITGYGTTDRTNAIVIIGNFFEHNNTLFINNNQGQDWVITNNLFQRSGTAYQWDMLTNLNTTTILNNNIFLSRQIGDGNQSVTVFSNCNGTQIKNNIFIFTNTSVTNMNLGNNSALSFDKNLTYSVITAFNPLSGTNYNDTDPLFVSYDTANSLNNINNDFHIQGGAAHKNGGTDGNDLGVFNGLYPFNLRGYPTTLPYITDFVISNNVLSEGTDLNINVKANANNN